MPMNLEGFKTKEEFEHFLENSFKCICGELLTGLHELSCSRIQALKMKFTGKQDNHPAIKAPKVTD